MKKTAGLITLGFITGILNGLFGSGGGTIVVPALVFLFLIEDHKAHASAIAVILPLTIISSFIYIEKGVYDIPLTIKVGLGTVLGGYIGARLLNKLSSSLLKKIFGAFMIIAALRMWFS
ncbi:sulfite exporter TauE/SafE family protein [Caldanaerobius polysaccharolyticus]|uniref:sulfite exporter TauE/SafE family protein n=1 Tax=Caldanaerobius polysaccharolyticus TaxID=44256 RepID=UPI00047AC987|nr:sulfite exporter TauE/SafE family protein [Caldanaerobius polysaccharolyticus]